MITGCLKCPTGQLLRQECPYGASGICGLGGHRPITQGLVPVSPGVRSPGLGEESAGGIGWRLVWEWVLLGSLMCFLHDLVVLSLGDDAEKLAAVDGL